MDETGFFAFDQLRPLIGNVCRNTLAAWERAGKFPRRVQLSPGRIGWSRAEVARWERERLAARDGGATS